MKRFGKPVLFVILFQVIQAVVTIVSIAWVVAMTPSIRDVAVSGDSAAVTSAIMESMTEGGSMSMALVISSVVSILVMMWPFREFRLPRDVKPSGIGLKKSAVAVVGSIAGAAALNVIGEYMDLPDMLEADLGGMIEGLTGCLVIAVIAPIAEEVVFRSAILGYMLRKGVDKWTAIIVSGLLFGLMHINPAQVPFASAIGVMLGIIYYKTGNIILTSIIHVLNNSVSVLLSKTMGVEATMSDLCGGPWGAFAVMCVTMVVCVYSFRYFWRSTEDREYVECGDGIEKLDGDGMMLDGEEPRAVLSKAETVEEKTGDVEEGAGVK